MARRGDLRLRMSRPYRCVSSGSTWVRYSNHPCRIDAVRHGRIERSEPVVQERDFIAFAHQRRYPFHDVPESIPGFQRAQPKLRCRGHRRERREHTGQEQQCPVPCLLRPTDVATAVARHSRRSRPAPASRRRPTPRAARPAEGRASGSRMKSEMWRREAMTISARRCPPSRLLRHGAPRQICRRERAVAAHVEQERLVGIGLRHLGQHEAASQQQLVRNLHRHELRLLAGSAVLKPGIARPDGLAAVRHAGAEPGQGGQPRPQRTGTGPQPGEPRAGPGFLQVEPAKAAIGMGRGHCHFNSSSPMSAQTGLRRGRSAREHRQARPCRSPPVHVLNNRRPSVRGTRATSL